MFINREDELDVLRERWESPRAEFLVLYGRRRVGKSHLLTHFADQGRRSLIFEATSGTSEDNLADISREIAALTGRGDHLAQPFTSWRAVLAAFEEICRNERTMLLLDEFQFIAREEPEIGSLINRLIERNRDNANFFLVISGSDVSFFANEIMGYAATTYGRRTASMQLLPFRFEHARRFVPNYSAEDRIRTYSAFGGMPYYLEDVASAGGIEEAIFSQVLAPGAKLRDEPTFLLARESKVREADVYKATLRAIAGGLTRSNEIAQRIHRERQVTTHYLDALEEMRLIEKRFPVTQATAGRTYFWQIKDPFLRFWFKFVAPNESRLVTRDRAARHLEQTVTPQLDHFVSSPGFEEVCREWSEERVDDVARIGSWWGSRRERGKGGRTHRRYEVDVAAVDAGGRPVVLGSCKWTNAPHGVEELVKLRVVRDKILEAPGARLLLFSRNGVDDEIAAEADADPLLELVSLEDLNGRPS